MQQRIFLLLLFCLFLISCSVFTKTEKDKTDIKLDGSWELVYVTGPRIAFNGLYPDRKPQLNFDLDKGMVSGNTSCNSLTGPLKLDGNKISFKQGLATTKMLCQGSGEGVFLKALETVEIYQIKDDTLSFSSVNGELMRFVRK